MSYQIIKADPPQKRTAYPFAAMQVGDAFDVPVLRRSQVAAAAAHWTRRNNPAAKFSVRLIDDATVRVYRVK